MNGPGPSRAQPPAAGDALRRLAARAAEEGPPLDVVTQRPEPGPAFAELAASGPRAASDPAAYAFVVEAVREGYLCHYGASRILDGPDRDLALLAGDLFYAIGISALAELDDVESVRLLSDLIRVSADLRADGAEAEAEVVWVAAIVALACGSDDRYEDLLGQVSRDEAAVREALGEWSAARAESDGLGRILAEMREAIHFGTDA